MTLDDDTLAALGYGNQWEQLALRFGPWSLRPSTRRDWRKGRTTTQRPPASTLTTAQRREASRLARAGLGYVLVARRLGVSPSAARHYLAARRAAA